MKLRRHSLAFPFHIVKSGASGMSRRRVLTLAAGALGTANLAFKPQPAAAEAGAAEMIESHGLSAFGDLAYPPDFAHFSYVNPSAPKGGMFSQIGPDRLYN